MSKKRCIRSVMKRPQHSCHVADRSLLNTPFRKRPRRLSLEVDNDVIFSGIKHLAEMEITMNSRSFRADLAGEYGAKAVHHLALKIQNLQGLIEHNASQRLEVFLQDQKHLTRMISHRLI